MRVLITQSQFLLGGTESYTVTVAEQLERLGHPTQIHAASASEVGRSLVASRGLRLTVGPVTGSHEAEHVDAVIAQDSGGAYALATQHKALPQIFVTHGFAPIERPATALGPTPAVVVLNDRTMARAEKMAGGPRLVRLRQPIDIERFRPPGPTRQQACRVLVLSNYLPADRLRMLEEVCAELGLEVRRIGDGAEPTIDPRPALADADIVIGYGRSVLEGMAMGRASYVWDRAGGDGWVTPESYAAFEADGFSGNATEEVIDRARLRADLAAYRPELGMLAYDLVRANHSAAKHTEELVGLFGGAIVPKPSDLHETISLLARAETRAAARAEGAEHESRRILREHDYQRARADAAETAREEDQARLVEVEQRVAAELVRREAAEARIAEILASRSWRVLAPLRRLRARVGGRA